MTFIVSEFGGERREGTGERERKKEAARAPLVFFFFVGSGSRERERAWDGPAAMLRASEGEKKNFLSLFLSSAAFPGALSLPKPLHRCSRPSGQCVSERLRERERKGSSSSSSGREKKEEGIIVVIHRCCVVAALCFFLSLFAARHRRHNERGSTYA